VVDLTDRKPFIIDESGWETDPWSVNDWIYSVMCLVDARKLELAEEYIEYISQTYGWLSIRCVVEQRKTCKNPDLIINVSRALHMAGAHEVVQGSWRSVGVGGQGQTVDILPPDRHVTISSSSGHSHILGIDEAGAHLHVLTIIE